MRIGTFLCFLFGHKFLGREIKPVKCEFGDKGWVNHKNYFQTSYCVRCGIDKESVK